MTEFEYRGYRIRTIFEKDWRVKVWPPLHPVQLAERIRASHAEGENACRHRATATIDEIIALNRSKSLTPRP